MQLGVDNFARSVGSGLGTASDSQAWNVLTGTSSHYSVNSGTASYSYDSLTFSKTMLGFGVSQDFNFLARFKPASANDFFGFYYRHVDANNFCSAQINASGLYSATVLSAGVEYDYLGGAAGVTAGVESWLRVAITGTSIQLKAWADGTTEPTPWGATLTDSNSPWIGRYGTILRVGTTATSISFDNFSASNNISTQLSSIGGYVFAGSTAVGGVSDVPAEIADGRRLDRIKPEYWDLNNSGVLVENTVASSGWDGYSSANATLIKAHSTQQFVTVSAGESSTAHPISTLAGSSTLMTNFNNTLVTFCTQNGFTGIELDFEHRGGWTGQGTLYGQLKTIITSLGNALHAAGLKLMVDGPAFASQGSISWTWSDFNTLPVDYVCPLVYDNQFDTITGGSTSPGPDYALSPISWMTSVINFIKGQINNINQIVIAVTSEGYSITNDDTSFNSVVEPLAYQDMTTITGFSGASRDLLSGEQMWTHGGSTYVYCDEVTMNTRLQVCLGLGIVNVDVWYLGGANKYPTVLPAVTSGGGTGGTGIVYTNAGRDLIRDGVAGKAGSVAIKYVALGTGANSATVNDTRLQNETFRKAISSVSNGTNVGEVVVTMYLSPSDAVNMGIKEYGFFAGDNATSAANSGVLFARAPYVHTHLNTESIQFSLDFTA